MVWHHCDICGREFKNIQGLLSHQKFAKSCVPGRHADTMSHQSDMRGQKYRNLNGPNHPDQLFQCGKCEKLYRYRTGLQRHRRKSPLCKLAATLMVAPRQPAVDGQIHEKANGSVRLQNPFQCDVCAKAYKHRSSLRKHKLFSPLCKPTATVTGSRKSYICDLCGQSYRDPTGLIYHKTGFLSKCNLNQKATNVGQLVRQKTEKSKPFRKYKTPFRCDVCGRGYKDPGGLKYHKTRSLSRCNPNHKAFAGEHVVRQKADKVQTQFRDLIQAQRAEILSLQRHVSVLEDKTLVDVAGVEIMIEELQQQHFGVDQLKQTISALQAQNTQLLSQNHRFRQELAAPTTKDQYPEVVTAGANLLVDLDALRASKADAEESIALLREDLAQLVFDREMCFDVLKLREEKTVLLEEVREIRRVRELVIDMELEELREENGRLQDELRRLGRDRLDGARGETLRSG